jgi:hypothetical protein
VKLDVPAHPKEKNIRAKIASAMNIFNHLLIVLTPPFEYEDWSIRMILASSYKKFNH